MRKHEGRARRQLVEEEEFLFLFDEETVSSEEMG
jgi:hypothetical protein